MSNSTPRPSKRLKMDQKEGGNSPAVGTLSASQLDRFSRQNAALGKQFLFLLHTNLLDHSIVITVTVDVSCLVPFHNLLVDVKLSNIFFNLLLLVPYFIVL